MSALKIFSRTNSKGLWNIASWHSMHSITWTWILSFGLYRDGERRWRPTLHVYRTNQGLQWFLALPLIGKIQWHRQAPMWWRDVYMRAQREGRVQEDAFDAKIIAAMAWEKGYQAGVERSRATSH